MEDKIKHLEFIQQSINRMSTNSFTIKGWSITVVSALLALFATNNDKMFILIALVSTILFAFLDAYYLQIERKFRGIYNDVAGLTNEGNRIIVRPFEMPLNKYQGCKYCYFKVLFSTSVIWLYGVIVVGLILLYIHC